MDETLAEQTQQIKELSQALNFKAKDEKLKEEAYNFVQQMINEGEIDLDDNGNVMPLNSKIKLSQRFPHSAPLGW